MSIHQSSSSSSTPSDPSQDGKTTKSVQLYKYKDHAHERDPLKGSHLSMCETVPIDLRIKSKEQNSVRYHRFPLKLHIILSQDHFSDIISWMPHGRAWKVLNAKRLEQEVLPLCFENANYNSFNRMVNAWSFRRVTSGPDQGAYYHEFFLRGLPHLQLSMKRLPRKGRKMPMNIEDEPNFYKMTPSNPPGTPPSVHKPKSPIIVATEGAIHSPINKSPQNPPVSPVYKLDSFPWQIPSPVSVPSVGLPFLTAAPRMESESDALLQRTEMNHRLDTLLGTSTLGHIPMNVTQMQPIIPSFEALSVASPISTHTAALASLLPSLPQTTLLQLHLQNLQAKGIVKKFMDSR